MAELLGRFDGGAPQIDEPTRKVSVRVESGGEQLIDAMRWSTPAGVELDDIALRQPNLDEVFLALTGDPNRHRRRPRRRPGPNTERNPTPMTTLALTPDSGAGAGLVRSTATVTRRALLRYVRTPQLIVMATIQMSMFFLIYRYLFGGAIHIGGLPYVDFLVPGFIATGVLFSGIGAAVATAEDLAAGLHRPAALAADPAQQRAQPRAQSPTRRSSRWPAR